MIEGVGQPRLLLVDDEADWLEEASDFLRGEGYRVDCVQSAVAAQTRLTSGLGYWVCVLDLHLGDANGIALLLDISSIRLPVETQFVLISGAADVNSVIQGFRHGISDFLQKPAEPGVLLAAIERAVALFEQSAIARSAERLSRPRPVSLEGKIRSVPSSVNERETLRTVTWLGRLREKHFPIRLSEPEWLMIVDAYEAFLDGAGSNVTSICFASGEPHATAHRYLNRLVSEGILVRRTNNRDARVIEIIPSAACLECFIALVAAAKQKVAT